MIQLIGSRKDKWINQTGSNILTLPRGQFKGIAIQQIETIFGVPIVFWLQAAYDYRIKINIPAWVLNNYIFSCTTLPDKYLLLEKDQIRFPKEKRTMKITALHRYGAAM
jgi:hypothetical protein